LEAIKSSFEATVSYLAFCYKLETLGPAENFSMSLTLTTGLFRND